MGEIDPHTERATRGVPRWSLVLGILAFVALAPFSAAQGTAEGASEAAACEAEAQVRTTEQGVAFVRTPDACFGGLPGWPYPAQVVEIDGLRQAYVDVGPADGEVVLLLHGQASWSYLYRHMIPVLADAGYRVVAMDHLGMGRSDKPVDIDAWLAYAMTSTSFRPSEVVEGLTWFDLPAEDEAGYDAPYPSRIYMTGPRVFASLINDVPGTTRPGWEVLTSFQKPFLTIWSSNNPVPLGSREAQQSFIDDVPGWR